MNTRGSWVWIATAVAVSAWIGIVVAEETIKLSIFERLHVAASDRYRMIRAYVDMQHDRAGLIVSRTSFRQLIADFLDAVDQGRPPRISGREALAVHRLIDALLLSAAEGRRVAVG